MRKAPTLTFAAMALRWAAVWAALGAAEWSFAQVQPAAEPAASTAPSTRPGAANGAATGAAAGGNAARAVVPADASTPRGALKVLLSAMQSADADRLHALLLARSPLEERMVDAIVNRADAEKRFRTAVEKAFGPDGARVLVNDSEAQNAAGMAQLDAADEKIDGERAQVAAGQGSEMRLQKVNGAWKIPIAQFAASPAEREAAAAAAGGAAAGTAADQQAPAGTTQPSASTSTTRMGAGAGEADGIAGKETAIEQKLDDEKLAVQIINDMTGEIEQGKYKTPQEAADAIRMKMMVEMMKRTGASQPVPPGAGGTDGGAGGGGTGSTTQPATQPSRTS